MSEEEGKIVVGYVPPGATESDCDCCEGTHVRTPAPVANRPGLPKVAYRVGTHGAFKSSMLARLSAAELPARAALRTRNDDDFSIALIDAWAAACDVLTFYQERIANEAYLATAEERLSIIEFARLIGYRPRPGVAAETQLAFTLETAATPGTDGPREVKIPKGTRVQSVPGSGESAHTFETVEEITARPEWNALRPRLTQMRAPSRGDRQAFVAGTSTGLRAGDFVLVTGSEGWEFKKLTEVEADAASDRTRIAWPAPLAWKPADGLPTDKTRIFAMRQRASLFGHNAPHPNLLHQDIRTNYRGEIDETTREWQFDIDIANRAIFLDAIYPAIAPVSWVVLIHPESSIGRVIYRVVAVSEIGLAKYAVAGRSTRVILDRQDELDSFAAGNYRATAVYAQSDELELAAAPVTSPVGGDSIEIEGRATGLLKGQRIVVRGRRRIGLLGAETAIIKEIEPAGAEGDCDRIVLERHLSCVYWPRKSVEILANVARATHGETASEILGSGDTSRANQRFVLKQAPLTHVSAATETGAESSLEIRVGDVLWHEAPNFYGRGPKERIYGTLTRDNGETVVAFGDGLTGARIPTGQNNVFARYRKGIGSAGNVERGAISLLTDRPLGVCAAFNPVPASGGADPETRDEARRSAPFTVKTLGRVVSLKDYEDFARSFAGIAKTHAAWLWNGKQRAVLITVAGPGGARIAEGSRQLTNLIGAMRKSGDPFIPIAVKSYLRRTFELGLKVKIDPDHRKDKVLAGVETEIRRIFSFDMREFGQSVALSEVVAAAHRVAGVIAVDIDVFRLSGARVSHHRPWRRVPSVLRAGDPQFEPDGSIRVATILTLATGPLHALEVMT